MGAAGFLVLIWSMPHYAASLTCVIFLLLVQAIRHLRTFRLGGRLIGLALSWAIIYLLASDAGFFVRRHLCDQLDWTCKGDPSRTALGEKLSHTPRQAPDRRALRRKSQFSTTIGSTNGAEIDTAKVLWARELDPVQNAKLFAYFKDRQIWLVRSTAELPTFFHHSSPLVNCCDDPSHPENFSLNSRIFGLTRNAIRR